MTDTASAGTDGLQIEIDSGSGFCFGVTTAIRKAEEELAVKEDKLDALKEELLRPEYQSSYSKLTEIQGEIDALEEEIMADMENWEELSQQLEELEG